MIVTRFIRVEPLAWAPSGPGLRLNYIGCFSTNVPTPKPTVPFIIETPAPPSVTPGLHPQITPTPKPITLVTPPNINELCKYCLLKQMFHSVVRLISDDNIQRVCSMGKYDIEF